LNQRSITSLSVEYVCHHETERRSNVRIPGGEREVVRVEEVVVESGGVAEVEEDGWRVTEVHYTDAHTSALDVQLADAALDEERYVRLCLPVHVARCVNHEENVRLVCTSCTSMKYIRNHNIYECFLLNMHCWYVE